MWLSCKSQKAVGRIESKLHIIEMKVHNDPKLNLDDVEPAIIFLEETTGIISQSNGNYAGRYQPTLNDYNRWSDWLEKNRHRVYWDDASQKVKIRPNE